jgi:Asparaginase
MSGDDLRCPRLRLRAACGVLWTRPAVGVSVTGVGEHVMRADVARQCAERVAAGRNGSPTDAVASLLEGTVLEVRPPGHWSPELTAMMVW